MKIYEGKTKKYRIRERSYYNSNEYKMYYIQWMGKSWFDFFWFGDLFGLNSFNTFGEAEEQVKRCVSANITKYNHNRYVDRVL